MKKFLSVLMTLAIMLSLAACGSGKNAEGSSPGIESELQTAEESSTNENMDETGLSPDKPEQPGELSSDVQKQEQSDEPSSDVQEEQIDEPSAEGDGTDAKALVVYFSATGNTKAVAETLAGLEEGATVLDGLHVSDSAADSAESSVSEWLGSIGLAE